MTDPWEETWTQGTCKPLKRTHGLGGFIRFDESCVGHVQCETFAVQKFVNQANEALPGRLRLAAAAPEMARVLQELLPRIAPGSLPYQVNPRHYEQAMAVLTKAGVAEIQGDDSPTKDSTNT
jgi:hypothetical protein